MFSAFPIYEVVLLSLWNAVRIYLGLCICIYITVCLSLARERLNGLSNIDGCPVSMSILNPKIGALEMGPEITMSLFSRMASTILIKFQLLVEITVPNKSVPVISSEK